MKKILAAYMSALAILSLTACSSAGQSSADSQQSAQAQPTTAAVVSQDKGVNQMSFTAPEAYKTVERYIEKYSDGKLAEKDITYNFEDESSICYACMFGITLADEIPLEKTTAAEYNGVSYQMYETGKNECAFLQKDADAYAVRYKFADSIDKEKFDKVMANVKFTENADLTENNIEFDGIQYILDSTLNVYCTTSTLKETPDGTAVEKRLSWKFGKDKDNEDFAFLIAEYKNTTVEQQLKKDKKYEQKQVGNITYTVRADSDGKPYEYYTQHGSDVYLIRNNGKSGFVTTRSDKSVEAFEKLLSTISFK